MGTVRVGLTQRVEDLPERAERRDALDQRWAALLEATGFLPIAVPNTLADPTGFLEAAGVAVLVLTGGNDIAALPGATSPAPERDTTESALLDSAAARGLPVLGVCRGLQMMLHHGGATLRRVEGHVGRPHPICVADPAGIPLRDGRTVNSFHDWGALPADLGPDYVALALAPDGTVEAARHRTLPFVGVMWHPEREADASDDLALLRGLVDGSV